MSVSPSDVWANLQYGAQNGVGANRSASQRPALAFEAMEGTAADLADWASSGAMALTGAADGPPSPAPARLASACRAAAADLAAETVKWGERVDVDGPALLGERAAITGMTRNGSTSVGGAARFVAMADGWAAINLPRPEDVASLPALISRDVATDDWPAIESGLRQMTGQALIEQATLLGMAVGVDQAAAKPVSPVRDLSSGGARLTSDAPLIVDLTSLWAGPLATGLLACAGARVIKVEGRGRADGARRGARAFFDLLNHAKQCLELDFKDPGDVGLLHRLIAAADLVVEGSRPRVMDQLGIDPAVVARNGTAWLSITAHGRNGPAADRVGFGDDAAVTGGLILAGHPPMFVADAVADPLTGLIAAVAGAAQLASDRASVVEVPLAHVAAWADRGRVQTAVHRDREQWLVEIDDDRAVVEHPRHRPIPAPAAPSGAHDELLRAEFG